MKEIYFDNSATTRVLPEVTAAMVRVMEQEYGNPSSLHGKGAAAARLLQEARLAIASLIGASKEEIFFTSGGTEANNWAVIGAARRRKSRGKHIITTQIEHPSVLAAFQYLEEEGFRVTYLPVNWEGLVDPADLRQALTADTGLVSVMLVNNEVGTIQPVEEIGSLVKELAPQALFHVDAVQAAGRIPIPLEQAKVDLLTLSGHKLHGPKGIGALYIRRGVAMDPLHVGGEQENKLRAGTENMPGIVGFGSAAQAMAKGAQQINDMFALGRQLRERLLAIKGCHINGSMSRAVPYIINVWFEGVDRGEVLVHMLEERGLYVSTGSACHSRRDDPSHVLKAMGKKKEALYGAIRLSLSPHNTAAEVEEAGTIIEETVKEYRDFKGGFS
ncbi:MAG TPA: cysteine desulfurase [Clostridia bacterium]|nr:cysteine desulfurase [Clostridia bacterium]